MRVAIVLLALCGIAAAQTVNECIAIVNTTHEALQLQPASCTDNNLPQSVEETTQFCRDCTGPACQALTGSTAQNCSRLLFEGCLTFGVYVPQCFTGAMDRCVAAVDLNHEAVRGLPASCSAPNADPTSAQDCRNCIGAQCLALTGVVAGGCRVLYYENCRTAGVNVSECLTGDDGQLSRCLSAVNSQHEAVQNLPSSCAIGAPTGPAESCGNCAGARCLALAGEIADDCRGFFYDSCNSFGVEVSECGALALVTVKGVLVLGLLIVAFLVF